MVTFLKVPRSLLILLTVLTVVDHAQLYGVDLTLTLDLSTQLLQWPEQIMARAASSHFHAGLCFTLVRDSGYAKILVSQALGVVPICS